MILASILITSDGHLPPTLPPLVQENVDSFRHQHRGIDHTFFDDAMIRDFLSVNFDDTVLWAYDEMTPYAYKADLARYCILYKLGGVYCDLSFFVLAPFLPVDNKLAVFRDMGPTSPWDVYNGLIGAPAGHRALLKSIEMICHNVKRRHYGTSPVCPTGPTLFGKAIALTCEPEDLIVGEIFRPHGAEANSLIDLATNTLIAVNRKKAVGTVDSLGITNGNNYRDMWDAKEVYRIDVGKPKIWSAKWLSGKHYAKGTLDGEVLCIEGSEARTVAWGPYTVLDPGEYVASVVCDERYAYGDFTMDVVAALGRDVLAQSGVSAAALAEQPFRLPFRLWERTLAIEIRLHAAGPHKISLKQVQVEKGAP